MSSDKLSFLRKYFVSEEMVKPNRKVFVFKAGDLRSLFKDLIDNIGLENFYVSNIIATDFKDQGKIRLDYYVVLLPGEEVVVFRTFIPRDKPEIDTLLDMIPGVLNAEAEVYDLMGIVFRGNNTLRRGFFVPVDLVEKGIYPLRKDAEV
ncbi:NADH dehydrogenase (ubiquinone), 30 kDa subunit [Staphylothermus marinus F1]|uniref:NADH dehydrogenase (Ubiquinone), 30 kDa subunit n=1 Tax=Staphylothermus marinus (strain ATCC 43588 / DSM 3639 / JCM 9404 / F1) TaxID=399550 RepID=A3DKH3_STAMF|nr:NADH-quinone oxidoreductase subunit C [Staphylothermus marinus]ABN69133.1 NADH dehydrogenase (ubiquinone), 30 kDa subunit [Staphylothermus marinus F1]